jgi:hypothetical protein
MNNCKVPDGWSEFSEKWKKWKDSPYEVSTLGRVRNSETGEIRKPRSDDRKHHRVNLTWDGKREEPMLHRLVMDLFGPPKPSGENIVILHKDNNGENNRLSNLKWGTRSENVQQVYDDGLIKKKK